MKLLVASRDVAGTLGNDIALAAADRAKERSPRFHDPSVTALTLRNCADEHDYLQTFLRLLRLRHGASTDDFDIPRKPGPAGFIAQKVRRFLWKLFRYQHDRMVFQQNLINEMTIHAVEFELSQRAAETASLRRELAELRERMDAR